MELTVSKVMRRDLPDECQNLVGLPFFLHDDNPQLCVRIYETMSTGGLSIEEYNNLPVVRQLVRYHAGLLNLVSEMKSDYECNDAKLRIDVSVTPLLFDAEGRPFQLLRCSVGFDLSDVEVINRLPTWKFFLDETFTKWISADEDYDKHPEESGYYDEEKQSETQAGNHENTYFGVPHRAS